MFAAALGKFFARKNKFLDFSNNHPLRIEAWRFLAAQIYAYHVQSIA